MILRRRRKERGKRENNLVYYLDICICVEREREREREIRRCVFLKIILENKNFEKLKKLKKFLE